MERFGFIRKRKRDGMQIVPAMAVDEPTIPSLTCQDQVVPPWWFLLFFNDRFICVPQVAPFLYFVSPFYVFLQTCIGVQGPELRVSDFTMKFCPLSP